MTILERVQVCFSKACIPLASDEAVPIISPRGRSQSRSVPDPKPRGGVHNSSRKGLPHESLMFTCVIMLTFCGTLALVQLMIKLRDVLQPLLLAVFFCVLLIPLVESLQGSLLYCYKGQSDLPREIIKGLSVFIVLLGMSTIMIFICVIMVQSFMDLQKNQKYYQAGIQNIIDHLKSWVCDVEQKLNLGDAKLFNNVGVEVDKFISDTLLSYARSITSGFTHIIGEFIITMLYVIFWLSSPIKLHAEVGVTLRKYIMMKTFANLCTAICTGILFYIMDIELWACFAFITFVLNFIPELGPLIAIAIPLPIILIDSRVPEMKDRLWKIVVLVVSQLIFKFIFGNILEFKLIEQDNKMKMHPVIVLLGVAFFGYLWGPTGMLMSVPLLALMKLLCLEPKSPFPEKFRDYVLIILEGDYDAPDRCRYSQLLVDPSTKDTYLSRMLGRPPVMESTMLPVTENHPDSIDECGEEQGPDVAHPECQDPPEILRTEAESNSNTHDLP